MIFGLAPTNKFKVSFNLSEGFDILDNIMGKGWDVKPLKSNVIDCHFNFVTKLTVYLDRKFLLKFSFSYAEAPFVLNDLENYREKCKSLGKQEAR